MRWDPDQWLLLSFEDLSDEGQVISETLYQLGIKVASAGVDERVEFCLHALARYENGYFLPESTLIHYL